MVVSDLAGTNRHTLPYRASCLGDTAIVWHEPGKIAVNSADDSRQRVLLDVTTGKSVGHDDATAEAWSADGAWVTTKNSSAKAAVMPKGNPQAARTFTYTPPADEAAKYDGWGSRSISMDGRYVSVGWHGTDPSRQLGSIAIVDTVTSKVVKLPVTGALSDVRFLADGTVLVRLASGDLVSLDKQFATRGRTTEPGSVRNLLMLTYAP